nr:microfibrillar-associated protein 2 isoform X1 [Oryctolagus cuniculus]
MRAASLFLLLLPAGLLAQGQYDLDPLPPFPDHGQYPHYGDQIETPDYYEYHGGPQAPAPGGEGDLPRPEYTSLHEPRLPRQNQETERQSPRSLGPLTAERSSTRAPASTPYTSLANSVSTRSASTASAACTLSTRRSVCAPCVPMRSSCELTCAGTSSPSAA